MSLIAWTRILVITATLILLGFSLFGVIWLLSRIGTIVLLVLLAGLITVVLMPLVDWLEQWKPIPRPLAVVISYAGVLIVFGGLLYVVIPPLVEQANQLVQGLPQFVQKLNSPDSPVTATLDRLGVNLGPGGAALGSQAQEIGKAVLTNIAGLVRDITTVAVGFVVVLVVSFYFLNEGHDFRARLYDVVPPQYRRGVAFVQESVVNAAGGYVRAQLIVAFMVGVLAGSSAWLIGIRFPLIIGVLAGLFELIPFFGPTLGAIPAVMIALFQGSWVKLALIVVAFIIIQQAESNLIGPRIMAHGVGLHPLLVIVAVLIGIEVAGIWGALFAVPAAAILVNIGRRLYSLNRDTLHSMAA